MVDAKARVPKAVSKYVAAQGVSDVDLEQASQKDRTALLNAFYYSVPKDDPRMQEYLALKTSVEKRRWLSTWVMAAAQGKCTGWNSSSVSVSAVERSTGEWVTESMLAISAYLNSPEHAQIYIQKAKSRAYKGNSSLAEAGVMEYFYAKDHDISERSSTSTAGVKTKADLTAEEYDEIGASMQLGLERTEAPAKKPKTATPKHTHPVFAKLYAAKKCKDKALKMMRDSADKVCSDLDKVKVTKAKLANKGWPAALQDMLQTASDKVRASCESNTAWWGAEVVVAAIRLPGSLTGKELHVHENHVLEIEATINELEGKTAEVDDMRKKLDSDHKAFCTGTLADMVKIS